MNMKVSFVEGNRSVNNNHVNKLRESLRTYGEFVQPILYVKATAIGERKIFDVQTDKEVEKKDYENYVVVIDGQHRYKAAEKEDKVAQLKWQEADLEGRNFERLLMDLNSKQKSWSGADYINGQILIDPTNEVAQFAKELTKAGLSAKTANKYLFFKDKFEWSKATKEEMDKANIDRARKIWDVVKGFPTKVSKSSVIIDYIITNGGAGHWEEELNKVSGLSSKQKEMLGETKQKELKDKLAGYLN